jgi:hypothetical protein
MDDGPLLYGCSAGHTFTAETPGWDRLYCPQPVKGGQCSRPLLRLAPTDDALRDDLVDLEAELR